MARFHDGSTMFEECDTAPVTVVPLSLFAWVLPTTLTVTQCVMGVGQRGAASANFFELSIGSTNTIQANAAQAGSAASANTVNVLSTAGYWCPLLAVFASAASRTSYYGGGSGSNKNTNSTSKTPTGIDTLYIGARATNSTHSNFFHGMIAYATVWNVALTDGEAMALARGKHPLDVRPSGLVAHHLMNTPGTVIEYDLHPLLPCAARQFDLTVGTFAPVVQNEPPVQQPYPRRRPKLLGNVSTVEDTAVIFGRLSIAQP